MFILASALRDYPIYALLAISFYVSYRILDFPDLAMDSAFALGMATLVQVLGRGLTGTASALAIPFALGVGFLVGVLLALLHGVRGISIEKLLAGLILSFSLYSIAFRLNLYSTTQGLYTKVHLVSLMSGFGDGNLLQWIPILPSILALIVSVVSVSFLLRSRAGLLLRVAGHRPALLIETGRSPLLFLCIGLGFSGSLSALAGWLRASNDNYSDINTFGTFLYALASLLLGERLLELVQKIARIESKLVVQLLPPLAGALLMSMLIQVSLWVLSEVLKIYLSADVRLVIGLAVLLSAARSGEPFGRSGVAA